MNTEGPANTGPVGWWVRLRSTTATAMKWYLGLSESRQAFALVTGVLFVAAVLSLLLYAFIQAAVVTSTALMLAVLATVSGLCIKGMLDKRHRRRAAAVKARIEAEKTRIEAERLMQLERNRYLSTIRDGRVQPITDSGLLARNSETIWYRCQAAVVSTKGVSSDGVLYITSMRVTFISNDPFEIEIGDINAAEHRPNLLQIIGKSANKTKDLIVGDEEVVAAFIVRSVQTFHRQVDLGFERNTNRDIPQDVKTAVWQRDGGRCVQCGAVDYLEYDHVIPHSRGGANTVQNVQILCRRCNLKKGAAI